MGQNDDLQRLTDQELLRAATRNNHKAFGIFCERVLPGLLRHLDRLCQDHAVPRDLAHDFAQDAILKIVDLVNTRTADLNKSYLFTVASHLLIDWVRENRRSKRATKILAEIQAARPNTEEIEKREEVLKFFDWLTPREREVIELVLQEGLTPLEAGERLDISPDAAYKAYERAIVHLRDLIEEHGEVPQTMLVNR